MNTVGYWLDNRTQTASRQKVMRDCIEATPPDTKWVMQVSSFQADSLSQVMVDGYDVEPCIETQGQLGDSLESKAGWDGIIGIQNDLIAMGFTGMWLDHESLMTRAKLFNAGTVVNWAKVREYSAGLTRDCKWYISGWFNDTTTLLATHTRDITNQMRTQLANCFEFVGLRFAYGHVGKILSNKTTNKYWAPDYCMTDRRQLIYVNTPYNRWETAWLLDNTSDRSFMRPVRRCWGAGQIPYIYPGVDNTNPENTLKAIKTIQSIVSQG